MESLTRGILWELIAGLAGLFYLLKIKNAPIINRIFVYLLWFTLWVDLAGFYAFLAYFTNYEFFPFVKGTVWVQNYWLYNILNTISFVVYASIFIVQLENKITKKILWYITGIFFLISWINLLFFEGLFVAYAAFTPIAGTILLLITIGLYFYQILRSERILKFYKELPFYIAVGALLWHLSITPLFIYNNYVIMANSPAFVRIYLQILTIMNIIMYGCYTAGFLVLIKKHQGAKVVELD